MSEIENLDPQFLWEHFISSAVGDEKLKRIVALIAQLTNELNNRVGALEKIKEQHE